MPPRLPTATRKGCGPAEALFPEQRFDEAQAGREALDGPGNQLWLYPDVPREWEGWELDASYRQASDAAVVWSAVAWADEGRAPDQVNSSGTLI